MIHATQLKDAAKMVEELHGITASLADWPTKQQVIDSPHGAQVRVPARDGMLVTVIPEELVGTVLDAMRTKFAARATELRLQLQDLGVQLGTN